LRPKIVCSIPIRSAEDLLDIASFEGDLIELRLDFADDIVPLPFEELKKNKERLLVTLRDTEEGGVHGFSPELKVKLLSTLREQGLMYDVEAKFAMRYGIPTEGEVVSVHYLDRVPRVEEVAEYIRLFPRAEVFKVAVVAKEGYLRVLTRLLEYGKVAVMPLGGSPEERIGLGLIGSQLVYGYGREPIAAGQMSCSRLRNIMHAIFPFK
jgi:3-dehydroquinate dehydratase